MYLYSAFIVVPHTQSAQVRITQFYLQLHRTCLYLVSIHQMAPPQTEVADIQLQPTTHLSTPKGCKAELAWLAALQRTVISIGVIRQPLTECVYSKSFMAMS